MEDETAKTARIGVLGGDGTWSVRQVLVAAGVEVADFEPAPKQVAEAVAAKWHYGRASVRAGMLGHPRRVLQLVQELQGARPKGWIWEQEGQVDGFRPDVDPEGLKAGIETYRLAHLAALARLISEVDRLILPMVTRRVYVDKAGTCFGAPRGKSTEVFEISCSDEELRADLQALREALRALNPRLVVQLCWLSPEVDLGAVAGYVCDPVFDALLKAEERGKGLLAWLARGGDLDAYGGAPVAVAAPVEDDRARRRARKEKRKGKDNPGKVVCEDELLEAFAK